MLSEEQMKLRSKGIGGSDVAGIFNISKWNSPLSIYLSKIDPKKVEDNQFIEWGNKLEPLVADKFTEETGIKLEEVPETLVSKEHDFIIAHIDRKVVGEDVGVEIKTASQYKVDEWDEAVPKAYILQCMHYMYVTGWNQWHICVLIGGNEFRWFTIDRDQEMIDTIVKKEIEFWNEFVLKKIAPSPTDADTELVKEMFKKSTNTVIELDVSVETMLYDLKCVKDSLNELDKRKKSLENKIKAYLGENEIGISDKYRVSWKNQTRSTVDTKALKSEFPLIYARVHKQSDSRRFLVKELS